MLQCRLGTGGLDSTELFVAQRVTRYLLDISSRSKWLGTNVYSQFLLPREARIGSQPLLTLLRNMLFASRAWLCG